MRGGHTGPITPDARVVLMMCPGNGHLLALPHRVLGSRVVLQLRLQGRGRLPISIFI